MNEYRTHHILQVVVLFFILGIIAYREPSAHIAMMHDKAVKRRK